MLIILSAAYCQASPVPDHSLGRLTLTADTGFSSFSPDYADSEIGYHAGLAAGLGLGLAAQYSYTKYNNNIGLRNQQITLYDHLLGPAGVFVGASQTATPGADPQNGIVCGVAGSVPLAPRTSAYAVLSAGNHISGREIGLGYKLDKNAELNLLYRNIKYTGLKFAGGDTGDVTFAGFFSGLSYKL